MTTSPGPARRAMVLGLTPAAYAVETVEAFETMNWLDRASRHRVRATSVPAPRDASTSALRLLVSQYHQAAQLVDNDDVAAFCREAAESIDVVRTHRLIRDGAHS